ncbi:hypothetical protein V6N13_023351 [Hibiscus sabdariffa]
MELGSFRLCRSSSLKLEHVSVDEEEEDLGLGFVRYTHGFGRKRVGSLPLDSSINAPLLKRQRSERMMMMMDDDEKSAIETLPQDVLIRIICGISYCDCKADAFRIQHSNKGEGFQDTTLPRIKRSRSSERPYTTAVSQARFSDKPLISSKVSLKIRHSPACFVHVHEKERKQNKGMFMYLFEGACPDPSLIIKYRFIDGEDTPNLVPILRPLKGAKQYSLDRAG